MIRQPVVLITGAGGEMGHGLIHRISEVGSTQIIALDMRPLDPELAGRCADVVVGNILDLNLLDQIGARYEISAIFHLAAMLSTRGEFVPETAHDINVQGTLNMLRLAVAEARNGGQNTRFLFPSSIAAYGIPTLEQKNDQARVREDQFLTPTTMYGVNKLACEHLGRYFTHHYRQLAADRDQYHVDFRAIRFPGLISAETVPTGGTSDFAPEMLHAAARGESYACFARPDTRIPFMAMPDAIDALLDLYVAPAEALTLTSYNIGAFAPSAEEVRAVVLDTFPGAAITYTVDQRRQGILDTWPADVDDSRARDDWGWAPKFDFERAFNDYLMPSINRRYATA
jgi:nucleoside-diphosphate-sugar epimerase